MAVCTDCGKKIGMFANSSGGMCEDCGMRLSHSQSGIPFENRLEANAKQIKAVKDILLTTETAPNLNITKRIEIVTAECAFGMNIFKDLFAGVRDIVGGRSEAVQKTMRTLARLPSTSLRRKHTKLVLMPLSVLI